MKNFFISLYICTLICLLFFSYAYIDSNLIYFRLLYSGFSYNYRATTTILFTSLVIILFVCYLFFIYLFQNKLLSVRDVKKLIITTITILFLSYPAMLSYDIFNYIATAKVVFSYKENPYIIMPIEFINDPLLLFTHAANKTALYGPVWITLTSFPFLLSFDNFLLTLFLFKLIPLVFYLYSLIILYKLSKNWYSILLFSLNPLVVIESLISSHNDIVMMGLALTAILLIKNNRNVLAMVFLSMSIGIKFSTIFLLPAFIYVIYRRLQKKGVNWNKMHSFSFLGMNSIFVLSPIREEMYSWYAIWFFIFVALMPDKKRIVKGSILFLFGLSLRYIPFMYVGTYDDTVIRARTAFMYIPLVIYISLIFIKKAIGKYRRYL